jgi:hypothetical protein
MLAPGCQPGWDNTLSDCKGVVMTCMSPALYAMHILFHFIYSLHCSEESLTARRLLMTGSREGEMSWHNGSLKSRAPSQTLCFMRHMYLDCLDRYCTSPLSFAHTY